MSISDYLELKLLDAVFNATAFGLGGNPWISLHDGDPGENGANEISGGSYVRQQAAFDPAASGAVTNSAIIDFAGMPAKTITYVGVWDDDGTPAGNFLWGGALTAPKTTNAGDTFRIAAGDLDVSLA